MSLHEDVGHNLRFAHSDLVVLGLLLARQLEVAHYYYFKANGNSPKVGAPLNWAMACQSDGSLAEAVRRSALPFARPGERSGDRSPTPWQRPRFVSPVISA